jgi:hypothetical protein
MGGKKGEPHRVVGSPANRHGGRINHGSTPIRVRKVGNRIVPYYSFELSDFVGAQLMTLTERPHVDVNKFGESFDVFKAGCSFALIVILVGQSADIPLYIR